jgi:hypothetical protein
MYGIIHELIPVALMSIFGKSLVVLRAFHQFGMLLWLIIAYIFGRILLKSRFFALLLAWLLIATRIVPFWSSRWGGMRNAIPFLAIVFLYLFNKKKKPIWLYLAGLINGVALLYAQEGGIAALFASGMFLFSYKWFRFEGCKESFIKLFCVYMGGLASIVLPIFFYLGINKALLTYFNICFIDIPFKFPKYLVDVSPYMGLLTKTNMLTIITQPQLARAFLFCMAFAIYIISFVYILFSFLEQNRKRDEREIKRHGKKEQDSYGETQRSSELIDILTLSVFGFFLLFFAIRQIHGMQFNIAAPVVLIVGCLLLEKPYLLLIKVIRKENVEKYKRNMAIGLNLTIILVILVSVYWFSDPVAQFKYLYTHIIKSSIEYERLKAVSRALTLERAQGVLVPKKQAEELEFVVKFIQDNTSQEDPIFVFPHNGEYYFLTGRICASRFTLATSAMISPEYEDEVIEDLKVKKPPYIIYVKDAYVLTQFNPIASEERIPKIFSYIKENYIPLARKNDTYILRLK